MKICRPQFDTNLSKANKLYFVGTPNKTQYCFKAQPTSPPLDIQLPTIKEEDKLQYDLQLNS
jgi:hypothetical protein